MNQKIELLAPAGNLESLIAGVNSGADAVYFGFGELNARRNAANFNQETFAEAARICKARGVKMHLTLNTVLYDRERDQLLHTLELACKNGIDAVIVQDLGAARLIREAAPELALHGSTQMTVHNLSGALALQEMGFSRAVLAREMSRDEIAAITRNAAIETEVFVHGALCMCVSGQCYMSSVIGERSGNRGLCAQPCRLPFSTGRGDDGFALSLKDLTLVERVEELVRLGVTSFKIEGRMKRPEYVAAAVQAFRQALDGERPDLERLEAAFSRSGFTQGYFDGRTGLEMFGTRQKEDVLAGQKVQKSLSNQIREEVPRVQVDFRFEMKAGEPVRLTAIDGEGHAVTTEGEPPQPARSRPTDEELVRRGLEKMGGTFYFMGDLNCILGEGLVCPVSVVNRLRRECLDRLTEQREAVRPVPFQWPAKREKAGREKPARPALRAQVRELSQATPSLEQCCELIAVPLDDLIRRKDSLPEGWRDKLAVSLPRASFGNDEKKLSPKLEELRRLGISHLTTGNLGGLYLGKKLGFTVHGEFGLNLTNSLAMEEYAHLGLADGLLSFELSLPRAKAVASPIPAGFFAYGKLPLMVTRNCPVKLAGCKQCKGIGILTDRKKEKFEVRCSSRNYSEVFNSRPLYLADKWEEFDGFDYGLLYFTGETREEVDRVVQDYTGGASSRDGITRGLYYRNVK